MTTDSHQPQEYNGYFLTRWGLEEYYDALANINGKRYADQMWDRVERDTRASHSAQQQRIEQVIKELELLRDTTYDDYGGRNAKVAYEKAIALLQKEAPK